MISRYSVSHGLARFDVKMRFPDFGMESRVVKRMSFCIVSRAKFRKRINEAFIGGVKVTGPVRGRTWDAIFLWEVLTIDIETPSPGDLFSEYASKNRPKRACDSPDHAYESKIFTALSASQSVLLPILLVDL